MAKFFDRLTQSCQSGANAAALASLITAAAPAGAQPAWAHQSPGFQSNGAVTVKSLSGGVYGSTENPAGTIAKVNQSAITQPPTIIIQATGSSYAVATTIATTTGLAGGVAGMNAMCVAEFGSGWKMATIGRFAVTTSFTNVTAWVNSASGNCNNWSQTTSTGIAVTLVGGGAGNYWGAGSQSCSNSFPVACANF